MSKVQAQVKELEVRRNALEDKLKELTPASKVAESKPAGGVNWADCSRRKKPGSCTEAGSAGPCQGGK